MVLKKQVISMTVNGQLYEKLIKPNMTLLDFIRDECMLTGTKKGCETGDCGACTVIIDGEAINSCMMMALDADGKNITTIEGLSQDGKLDVIQQAFVDNGAIQCGFCIPGMVMSTKALLDNNPTPSEQQVKRAMAGNLCRCTGYVNILKAIMAVVKQNEANLVRK
jgi:aerobic carbon-monoxide dehydrogenase small subunit